MKIRDALLNGPLGFGAAPLGNVFASGTVLETYQEFAESRELIALTVNSAEPSERSRSARLIIGATPSRCRSGSLAIPQN